MSLAEQTSLPFTINQLSPNIGAELLDIDLSESLNDDVIKSIYQALLDYKVIFFRDQDISSQQHLEFGRRFGNLEIHPYAQSSPGLGNDDLAPEVLRISHDRDNKGKENLWHSDVTWREEPSLGSILRARQIPGVGGDTLFSNMELAYDELEEEMKQMLSSLTAIHDAVGFQRRMKENGATEEELAAVRKKFPEQEHPVIRTHPDTGRKSIYVNCAFTQYIVGIERSESDELLQFLYSRAAIPEYQCRFRWAENSIAFWDNRTSQHYAASDYWPEVRIVDRVTIVGDKPH